MLKTRPSRAVVRGTLTWPAVLGRTIPTEGESTWTWVGVAPHMRDAKPHFGTVMEGLIGSLSSITSECMSINKPDVLYIFL